MLLRNCFKVETNVVAPSIRYAHHNMLNPLKWIQLLFRGARAAKLHESII